MNKLKILFLIDSFRMGGAERITAALLPHFNTSEVEPILCTLHTRRESELIEKVKSFKRYDLGAKRLLDPFAVKRLLKIVDDEQINVIHAQLQDATIYAAIINKLKGTPVVVTRHLIGDDQQNVRRKMRNWVEKVAVKASVAKVVSVSDAAGAYYAKLTGLPASRFVTIYNGIDLDGFRAQKDKQTLRKELGFPLDAPLVVMVGVVRPGKGHEVSIAAARQLPDVHFLLVGDGKPPYGDQLKAQIAGLEARVHWLGQRMDVPDILNASDILILPSDSEALPTVLIEAGAASLPVIATKVGGVAEIIQDQKTGILIDPQDADALAESIQYLVNHADIAQAMGQSAYHYVHQHFTLPGQAAALVQLYRDVSHHPV